MSSEQGPTVRVDAPTERINPNTADIDLLPTPDILRLLNEEDRTVPDAVGHTLPELAKAVDMAVSSLRSGGRVHYVGAGTSGRLAVLDAAELIPTYNAPPDWFVAHQAGGASAFQHAVEGAEDDPGAGAAVVDAEVSGTDFVLGLTASGRTPFVAGALAAARRLGAGTGLVSANPESANLESANLESANLESANPESANPESATTAPADVVIAADTGPEPITGSTRMKAGTAQKLVLTSFSTAVMIKLGRTYSNLMVSMIATNAKLRGRTISILEQATGSTEQACASALADADGDLKTALVHLLTGADAELAAASLAASGGQVRDALRSLRA